MTYKYDIAFSFLSTDLTIAETLADSLTPGLSTFVYSRHKEDLLGDDGMDRFAEVFKSDARLTVILFRAGWGETPWTAFEQAQIKDRALASRMNSFMVVRLDNSPLPLWVPATHLYASTSTDSMSDILAVIRARARQEGAAIRRETVAEYAIARKRARDSERTRREREQSNQGVEQVVEEVTNLIHCIRDLVQEVSASDPDISVSFGAARTECALASPGFSTSVVWMQPHGNTLRNARLVVNDWGGRLKVPDHAVARSSGANWRGATHFVPRVSESDEWVWREAPELDEADVRPTAMWFFQLRGEHEYRTAELADHLVRRHFRAAYGGG